MVRALEDAYINQIKRQADYVKSQYIIKSDNKFNEIEFTSEDGNSEIYIQENGCLPQIKTTYKRLPLINILAQSNDRPIRGISDSSAGAITAFMLAMGMSSEEIEYEATNTTTMKLGLYNKETEVNFFETFLEGSDYNHKIGLNGHFLG